MVVSGIHALRKHTTLASSLLSLRSLPLSSSQTSSKHSRSQEAQPCDTTRENHDMKPAATHRATPTVSAIQGTRETDFSFARKPVLSSPLPRSRCLPLPLLLLALLPCSSQNNTLTTRKSTSDSRERRTQISHPNWLAICRLLK